MRMIKNFINKVINKLKYKKIKGDITTSNTKLTFDIGASSIKCSDGKNYISFRSSVRKAKSTEISIQNNKVKVDNQWYIIGENNAPTGNYIYKYMKENLEVLIIHGINELKKINKKIDDDTIVIDVLLPYNQLSTIEKLKAKLNGTYNVDGEKMSIIVDKVLTEGEASKYFIDKTFGTDKSSVCINMGYSTIDCVLFDRNNNRQAISTINIGSNMLLSNYLKYFAECPSSSVLCSWFDEGFKLSNEEDKFINIENEIFLDMVWNDLNNSILRLCNKQNTTIYFMGGTVNLLGDKIEKNLSDKGYRIVVLKDEQAKYSDLIGAMLMSNNAIEVPQKEDKEVKSTAKKEVKKKSTGRRKSKNYSLVVQYIENGLSNQEIVDMTNLKMQTVKNYRCKYKRESREVA